LDYPRRLCLAREFDLPAFFVAVDSHDDNAGGLGKGHWRIEDQAAAAPIWATR
jgi:hypothetical protein